MSDIDWIIPSFFFIREGGDKDFLPATQNVTFILNIIDSLAGEDRFLEIRKRARIHRTLTKIDDATRTYRDKASEEREKFVKDIDDKETAAREAMQKKIDEVDSVLEDSAGEVKGVAIEYGGFLGFGESGAILTFDQVKAQDGKLITTLSEDELKTLPAWDK